MVHVEFVENVVESLLCKVVCLELALGKFADELGHFFAIENPIIVRVVESPDFVDFFLEDTF